MIKEICVGTGVRAYHENDAGFATGCVTGVKGFLDGYVSVLWYYWRKPGGSYETDTPDLVTKYLVEDLVVMSQPDHDFWPSFWNNENLWVYPEFHVRKENGEGFIARWQAWGAPANPWID